jgi:hypothetical protein
MLRNCSVASTKAHIANLTLAEILENAIGAVTIRISVFEAFFTCDNNNQRMIRGSYDTALLLPAIAAVNIEPPVVNAANLETPGHLSSRAAASSHFSPRPNLRPNGDIASLDISRSLISL